MKVKTEVESTEAMIALGAAVGSRCLGGDVIELVGDIGAGKTTFTKGLARTLGIDEDVQSPTFTISRTYDTGSGGRLVHYDFYRLSDPGILKSELSESVNDPDAITVIEWANIVDDVLPNHTIRVSIVTTPDDTRIVTLDADETTTKRFEGVFA